MRHHCFLVIVLPMSALSACVSLQAGDDPRGRRLKSEAERVLEAARAYANDYGQYPESLIGVVPRYLPELPSADIYYRPYRAVASNDTILIRYNLPWPYVGGEVQCTSPIRTTNWKCLGHY